MRTRRAITAWAALGVAAGVALAAATAHAQDVLAEHQGDATNSYYGHDGGVDYDGDGVPDFLTNGDRRPDVLVVSGKDGSTLRTFDGLVAFSTFASAFFPDRTADDVPEVLVGLRRGAGNGALPGEIVLLNGATGAALWTSPGDSAGEDYGQDIRLIPDVTSDGVPDVLAAGYLTARVISGADGARLYSFRSSGACCPSDRIAPAGDLDGDGVPDLLIGSQRYSGEFQGDSYPENGGLVRVISGKDGSTIREHRAKKPLELIGLEVVSFGDLDKDGVPDYAYGSNFVKESVRGGAITFYSGKRGKRLARLSLAPTLGIKSGTLLPLVPGDVDKDGVPDFAIRATSDNGTEFIAFVSGAPTDAPVLFRIDRLSDDFFTGIGLAGDVDKDGLPDVVVSYSQRNIVQVVRTRVLPKIPSVVANARAFSRAPGVEEQLSAKLAITVKKGVQTLAIVTTGLSIGGKAATGPFGVWLEDGVGAATFTRLGNLDAQGGYTIVGQGAVPPQLGVQSLADVVGRRVQLRDGTSNTLLETVVPGLVKAKKGKAKSKLTPTSSQYPKASLQLKAAFDPKTGALSLTAKVKNAGSGPFVFELETAAGSGQYEEIARIDTGKLKLSTATGAALAGAFDVADLLGRGVRVYAGDELVLEGTL